MEVNSGKSSQSLTSHSLTLKHNKRTTLECTITKEEGFEGRHVYSSLSVNENTLQLQYRSTTETTSHIFQITHFNHFQRIHILNLNHSVIREGITTHLQRLQLGTILQIEMTIWIITPTILLLSEAVHSNLHTLQLTHSNHLHFIHKYERIISNHNSPHTHESSQIQHSEGRVATAPILNDDLSHGRTESIQVIHIQHIGCGRVGNQIGMVRQFASIDHTPLIVVQERVRESDSRKKGHVYSSTHRHVITLQNELARILEGVALRFRGE